VNPSGLLFTIESGPERGGGYHGRLHEVHRWRRPRRPAQPW
jgi:hypothetical protein